MNIQKIQVNELLEKEWLQTGYGEKNFPNSDESSCVCNPGYESKKSKWLKLTKEQQKKTPMPTKDAFHCEKLDCPINSKQTKRNPPDHCDCNPSFTNQLHRYINSQWKLNVSGSYSQTKNNQTKIYRFVQVNDQIMIYENQKQINDSKLSKWESTNNEVVIVINGKTQKYSIVTDINLPTGKIKELRNKNKTGEPYIFIKDSLKSKGFDRSSNQIFGKCEKESCLFDKNVIIKNPVNFVVIVPLDIMVMVLKQVLVVINALKIVQIKVLISMFGKI